MLSFVVFSTELLKVSKMANFDKLFLAFIFGWDEVKHVTFFHCQSIGNSNVTSCLPDSGQVTEIEKNQA